MNVVSCSGGILTHGAHRAISYVWTLVGASRRIFFLLMHSGSCENQGGMKYVVGMCVSRARCAHGEVYIYEKVNKEGSTYATAVKTTYLY